ncbi:uncharacterized protein B4U79_01733, partial [Dinothrombium tinctorium]
NGPCRGCICPPFFEPVQPIQRLIPVLGPAHPSHQIDLLRNPMNPKSDVGQSCKYHDDCFSGCCVEDSQTKERSCQWKAQPNERCSLGNIKGGYRIDYCGCETGTLFNRSQRVKLLQPGEPGIEQKMYFDSPYTPKVNLSDNLGCMSSQECASGCCVMFRKRHICKSLAKTNEPCSSGQIKGGFYPRSCPCENENDVCTREKNRRDRSGRYIQLCKRIEEISPKRSRQAMLI